YGRKVAELELALNDEAIKAEAAEILRTLIDRVVLTPSADAPDGLDAQLYGELASVLALSDPANQKLPAPGAAGSQLSVVAGAGNQRYLHMVRSPVPRITAFQGCNTGTIPVENANVFNILARRPACRGQLLANIQIWIALAAHGCHWP